MDRVDVRTWAADHSKPAEDSKLRPTLPTLGAEMKPSSSDPPPEEKPTGFAEAGWDNASAAAPDTAAQVESSDTATQVENSPTHDRDRPDVSGPDSPEGARD
jgi:hypothetical protein